MPVVIKAFTTVLFTVTLAAAQPCARFNSTNQCAFGFRSGSVKPYLGLDLSAFFENDYNIKHDSLVRQESLWYLTPEAGIVYYFKRSFVDVFIDVNANAMYIHGYENYFSRIATRLGGSAGIGIEKAIGRGFAFSGKIAVVYSVQKTDGIEIVFYSHKIDVIPVFCIDYYIGAAAAGKSDFR